MVVWGCGEARKQGRQGMGQAVPPSEGHQVYEEFRSQREVREQVPEELATKVVRAILAEQPDKPRVRELLGEPDRVMPGARLPGTKGYGGWFLSNLGETWSYAIGWSQEMSLEFGSNGVVLGGTVNGDDVEQAPPGRRHQ